MSSRQNGAGGDRRLLRHRTIRRDDFGPAAADPGWASQGHSGGAVALQNLRDEYQLAVKGDRSAGTVDGEWRRGLADMATAVYSGGLTPQTERRCCIVELRQPGDERPLLLIENVADFNDVVSSMVGAEITDDIFTLGRQLMFVPMAGTEYWVDRPDNDWHGEEAQLIVCQNRHLARILDVRYWIAAPRSDPDTNETVLTHVKCPSMDRVVSLPEFLSHVRAVTGVVHAPVFATADGSLLLQPGYDKDTKLLYLPTFAVPPIPDHVTQADAQAALIELMKPVEHFPFVTTHDKANYVAALLTPALLHLLPPPWPLLCLNAPMPGSGKTLLGTCIRVLYGGTHRPSLPTDEEEVGSRSPPC